MAAERVDRLFRRARLATMRADQPGLGVIDRGAIAVHHGLIRHVGAEADLPLLDPVETIDCAGRWLTPGLIDAHTHLVHAGSRSDEFEARLTGVSYAEIAARGGGIASTVRATRAASAETLLDTATDRLSALAREGVTTVEIKSGYALDRDGELKMLRVARALGLTEPMTVVATLLAAHAIPPEHHARPDAYIDLIIDDLLPKVVAERLADAVDGFCETIAFSPAQIARVFAAAGVHRLPVKLHADQLSDLGGAALAAGFGALSADHLEYTSPEGVAAMAKAGTVAMMLPGAFYYLRETQRPPIEMFRSAGVKMALATDFNPGSSPILSLLAMLNLAAVQFRMTVEECWLGVTRHAAAALGRSASIGTLEVGKRADLALWDFERLADPVAAIGPSPLHRRIWGGQ